MKTYLINHLRIPGDVPNGAALDYLDQVEATVAPMRASGLQWGRGRSQKAPGRARSC